VAAPPGQGVAAPPGEAPGCARPVVVVGVAVQARTRQPVVVVAVQARPVTAGPPPSRVRVPASPAAARAPLRAKPKVSAAEKIKACAPGGKGRLRLWASTAAGEAGCSAGARPTIAPAELMEA